MASRLSRALRPALLVVNIVFKRFGDAQSHLLKSVIQAAEMVGAAFVGYLLPTLEPARRLAKGIRRHPAIVEQLITERLQS